MKAIFKHELSTYFTTVTGYIFSAFVLLFVGIYSSYYNVSKAYAQFEYALGSMTSIFLLAIPVLTMRVIAEERRQKTDQLLYSLPISMKDVVLGKFAALLVTFLVPLVPVALYPLVLKQYGNVYLPTVYGTMAGLFFLGAALLSMGLFISSITENQAVAAGLCFAVMLINNYMADLAGFLPETSFASYAAFAVLLLVVLLILWLMTRNATLTLGLGIVAEAALIFFFKTKESAFEGLFASCIEDISLFEKYSNFVNGIFDLRVIVFDLSVTVFFLFLTVQAMEKRRWQG